MIEPKDKEKENGNEETALDTTLMEIMETLFNHGYVPERVNLEGDYASHKSGIGFTGIITIHVFPKNGKYQAPGADI